MNKQTKNLLIFFVATFVWTLAFYTPIAAGMRDQWYADWPWMLLQICTLESNEEWYNTYLGIDGTKLSDPKYVETWTKWKELIDKSFFPNDVMSLDLYVGFDLFLQGFCNHATPVKAFEPVGWLEGALPPFWSLDHS